MQLHEDICVQVKLDFLLGSCFIPVIEVATATIIGLMVLHPGRSRSSLGLRKGHVSWRIRDFLRVGLKYP